ncbi:MAG: TIGR04283 family arsenosugar biosynthesis glycosyltransferase [Fuerstiella sp.]
MTTVSVIIPTLNEQSCIEAAIGSARDAGAAQIIVVDGGSTDQTVAAAERLATVMTVPRAGRAVQQNAGAAVAVSDVLLFLHADCRLDPEAIAELSEKLSSAPQIVGGCFRQSIEAAGLRYRLIEAGNAWRVRLLKWAYGDQAIFVRADVFRQLGGFPDLPFMEDLYFMKQLKHQGRILSLQSPLSVSPRRWQRNGVLTQTLRNWALIAAAHLGARPDRLVRFYPNER